MEEDFVYRQEYPKFAGRLTSPVKVTGLDQKRSFTGRLLWDTGAEMSVVSKCVAEACRLQTIPAGRMRSLVYEPEETRVGVMLVFPGDVKKFIPMQAAVMDDLHTDVDVILGMDVIGRGDFALIRKGEVLELRFAFGEDFMTCE